MIADSRFRILAQFLVRYSVAVKKRDLVLISGSICSEILIRELYREVIQAGGIPHIKLEFEDQKYIFNSLADNFQIDFLNPIELYEITKSDVYIRLMSDGNPYSLSSIHPEVKQRIALTQKELFDVLFSRWETKQIRWVNTICPTPALAQEAQMAFEEYIEFVFSAMNMNDQDPLSFWIDFSKSQQRICDRLNLSKTFHIISPDTDIMFNCEGRRWISSDGKFNFPDGEIFTSPIENSANGKIQFSYTGMYQGQRIEDIFLRFREGRIVEATAARGERLLHKILETDDGANFVGELAVGTNYYINRFSNNILFDEKIGGTIHIAIGNGIPIAGGKNKSAIHWDIIKDMKRGGKIYADGRLIYRDGQFCD